MKELIARLEAAGGADRELDALIYAALNPQMLPIPGDNSARFYDPTKTNARTAQKFFLSGGATGVSGRYTASLDAARTLVLEGWSYQVSANPKSAYATVVHPECEHEDDRVYSAGGRTPALAICIAALKARAA